MSNASNPLEQSIIDLLDRKPQSLRDALTAAALLGCVLDEIAADEAAQTEVMPVREPAPRSWHPIAIPMLALGGAPFDDGLGGPDPDARRLVLGDEYVGLTKDREHFAVSLPEADASVMAPYAILTLCLAKTSAPTTVERARLVPLAWNPLAETRTALIALEELVQAWGIEAAALLDAKQYLWYFSRVNEFTFDELSTTERDLLREFAASHDPRAALLQAAISVHDE